MSENPEPIRNDAEIREAIDRLTTELTRTRIAFAAMRTTLEDIIDRDACELLDGYGCAKRDMN